MNLWFTRWLLWSSLGSLVFVLQSAVALVGDSADPGQAFSYVWGLAGCRLVQDTLTGRIGLSLQSSSRIVVRLSPSHGDNREAKEEVETFKCFFFLNLSFCFPIGQTKSGVRVGGSYEAAAQRMDMGRPLSDHRYSQLNNKLNPLCFQTVAEIPAGTTERQSLGRSYSCKGCS